MDGKSYSQGLTRRQRPSYCIFPIMLFVISVTSANDAVYRQCRLIGPDYLTVGNHWDYEVHVSMWDSEPVDESHWMNQEISETVEVEGQPAAILHTVDSMNGDVCETLSLNEAFLLVHSRNRQGGNQLALAQEDPEEIIPVWVPTDANDMVFGTASVRLIIYNPPTEILYTVESRMTWLGQEMIDVPAGRFLCQVVVVERISSFPQEIVDRIHQTLYISPSIGKIRIETDEALTIPGQDKQQWVYTSQLKSTNVQLSSLCMLRPIIGDANSDCRVTLEDFPCLSSITEFMEMADHWLESGFSTQPISP
ncbi:MAG: hypothetical protein JXA82_05795 [Sedimentisphaerales bacterium]|nr:hypothetical protein [Sedimentisphaerales bacterium]